MATVNFSADEIKRLIAAATPYVDLIASDILKLVNHRLVEALEKRYINPRKGNFNIYINGSFKGSTTTSEEAWSIIGDYPFGVSFEVRDSNGETLEEFLVF